jgi:hypothetical protein
MSKKNNAIDRVAVFARAATDAVTDATTAAKEATDAAAKLYALEIELDTQATTAQLPALIGPP